MRTAIKSWLILVICWGLIVAIINPEKFYKAIKYSISESVYISEQESVRKELIDSTISQLLSLRAEIAGEGVGKGNLARLTLNDRVLLRFQISTILEIETDSIDTKTLESIDRLIEKIREKSKSSGKYRPLPMDTFDPLVLWLKPSAIALVCLLGLVLVGRQLRRGGLSLVEKRAAELLEGVSNTHRLIVVMVLMSCAVLVAAYAAVNYFSSMNTCVRKYIKESIKEGGFARDDELWLEAYRMCDRASGAANEGRQGSELKETIKSLQNQIGDLSAEIEDARIDQSSSTTVTCNTVGSVTDCSK